MREIKFRFFAKKSKEMITWEKMKKYFNKLTVLEDGEDTHMFSPFMQYTGLTDKNGTEIYEGDILETEKMRHNIHGSYVGIESTVGLVEFGRGRYSLNTENYGNQDLTMGLSYHTVMGNIYEHPQLMEEEVR